MLRSRAPTMRARASRFAGRGARGGSAPRRHRTRRGALRKVAADAGEQVKALSPVELERLIAGLSGRDRAIAVLAGHPGLRPTELRTASWGALQGDRLTVRPNRTEGTPGAYPRNQGSDDHGARAEAVAPSVRAPGR